MSRFLAPFASVLFAFLAWPVQALAKAGVRFVHAVPGASEAELTVEQDGKRVEVGSAGFGEKTGVRSLRPGPMRWSLSAGGKELASGDATVRDGRSTAIAIPRGSGVSLRLFHNASSTPRGKARVRVIHAAPELGTPDLLVDGKRVAQKLKFRRATRYLTLSPGRRDVEAVRPGTKEPLLSLDGVRFRGDTTTSAIVIGTRGEPARVITVSDRVARRESGSGSSGSRSRSGSGSSRTSTPVSRRSGRLTVKRGDSMWSIARANLGSDASGPAVSREVRRLWTLNARSIGTDDPNLIFPGQTIRLS